MQNGARGSVEGKGTWKGGALSQSLPLLAHSSYHSKGPGLMSKATTGTSALKGISAEKLLARKGLGVEFWAAYLLKGMGMLLLGCTHSSQNPQHPSAWGALPWDRGAQSKGPVKQCCHWDMTMWKVLSLVKPLKNRT